MNPEFLSLKSVGYKIFLLHHFYEMNFISLAKKQAESQEYQETEPHKFVLK